MKIAFRPLKAWIVNQKFGANQVCVDILTGNNYIACDGNNPPTGYRSVYGANGHEGLDLMAPTWTPLYAALGGRVIEKVVDLRRGLGIGILHSVGDAFYKSRYWHLISIDVDLDERLTTGDFLGYCDNTGVSTAPHLHFEFGTCDSAGNNYVPRDPEQYLFPTFALDAKNVLARLREQLAIIADKLADLARYGK